MPDSFKNRLVEAMRIREMKATELSKRSGLSKAQISQYTNGIYEAKQLALHKLAVTLNVSEAWLMGYDVSMERQNSSQISANEGSDEIESLDDEPINNAVSKKEAVPKDGFPRDTGEKIKALRKKHGLTLEEVGNAVGVGKSTVRKWETGMIANMRRDKIADLAKALHTTPAYLMGWEENNTQKQEANADPELSSGNMSFGTKLRDLRVAHGLTQTQLGEKLNLSKSNISKYESDDIEPNFAALKSISKLFNVSIDYLLERTDESDLSTKKQAAETDSLPKEEITEQVISLYRKMNARERRAFLSLALHEFDEQLQEEAAHEPDKSDS